MFASHFNNSRYSDFALVTKNGSKKLHLHRLILHDISYFAEIFCKNPEQKELEVEDDVYNKATKILGFLYCGKILYRPVTSFEEWIGILWLAERWNYGEFLDCFLPVAMAFFGDNPEKQLDLIEQSPNQFLYPQIITSRYFLDMLPRLAVSCSEEQLLKLVAYSSFRMSEVIKLGRRDLLSHWLSTHTIEASDLDMIAQFKQAAGTSN